MAEGWTKDWERRIVNGVYPLRRFLGQSDHSVVFLTDHKAQNIVRAAIKILPLNPARAEAQLTHWRSAAALSHPHLIRLLDSGRCQLGGHEFLFVVMEYAEQNLAQLLPSRALTVREVSDLLPSTLDALAYLHDQDLVQGGLKPSNFLVVHDQLKLASDTIRPAADGQPAADGRPAGERASDVGVSSLYDPPEAKSGGMSAAGDIWGLGITLVEALTQTVPEWSGDSAESVALPPDLAPEFADTLRRCLNRDAGDRPTVAELRARVSQLPAVRPPTAAAPAAAPVVTEAAGRVPASRMLTSGMLASRVSPRTRVFAISAIAAILTVGAIWVGSRLLGTHAPERPTPPTILPSQAPMSQAPVPSAPPTERPKAGVPASPPAVIHQAIPEIPRSVRESIRGVIKVAVRVSVDRAGNVLEARLEHRASSKYFERAATNAAAEWKFPQTSDPATRAWRLDFEFTRGGTTAHATESTGHAAASR